MYLGSAVGGLGVGGGVVTCEYKDANSAFCPYISVQNNQLKLKVKWHFVCMVFKIAVASKEKL
jgi:hypothetical protein